MNLETIAKKMREYADTIRPVSLESKNKLKEVLKTVRIPDVEDQAMEQLFSIDHRQKDFTAYTYKMMIIEILKLLHQPSVNELLLYPTEHKVYSEMLSQIFNFFDYLDSDDYNKMRRVDDILEYGEELPTKEVPYPSMNADWLYELYITRTANKIESLLQ